MSHEVLSMGMKLHQAKTLQKRDVIYGCHGSILGLLAACKWPSKGLCGRPRLAGVGFGDYSTMASETCTRQITMARHPGKNSFRRALGPGGLKNDTLNSGL